MTATAKRRPAPDARRRPVNRRGAMTAGADAVKLDGARVGDQRARLAEPLAVRVGARLRRYVRGRERRADLALGPRDPGLRVAPARLDQRLGLERDLDVDALAERDLRRDAVALDLRVVLDPRRSLRAVADQLRRRLPVAVTEVRRA